MNEDQLQLYTSNGAGATLRGLYRGRAAFLLCGGPSLTSHDLGQLHHRGILTCAVNNAAAVFRTHLWTSLDDPGNFCDAIWRDPGILKFVPRAYMSKRFRVRDPEGRLVLSGESVDQTPAVFGFRLNTTFVPEQWLHEESVNCGTADGPADTAGYRSVMYVALRLLFHLGIRRLYLLGCDFRMTFGRPNYAFAQDRTMHMVHSNNRSYRVLNQRLERLKPCFARAGYQIFNCTPESGLTVFPQLPYEQALEMTLADMPKIIVTHGMYDDEDRSAATARP